MQCSLIPRSQVRIALWTKGCFHENHLFTAIRDFGQGLHTYCSAQVDSAFHPPLRLRNDLYCVEWGVKLYSLTSTLRGMVNECQPCGWVMIPMAMGKWHVQPIAAYRRTRRSSLQLGLRVGGHLALTKKPRTQRNQSELSHMAGAIDDGTINIVVFIIIIIITPIRIANRSLSKPTHLSWYSSPPLTLHSLPLVHPLFPLNPARQSWEVLSDILGTT